MPSPEVRSWRPESQKKTSVFCFTSHHFYDRLSWNTLVPVKHDSCRVCSPQKHWVASCSGLTKILPVLWVKDLRRNQKINGWAEGSFCLRTTKTVGDMSIHQEPKLAEKPLQASILLRISSICWAPNSASHFLCASFTTCTKEAGKAVSRAAAWIAFNREDSQFP